MSTQIQNALITGGTSGIGLELAKLFAKNGYHLIIVARNQSKLDNVKAMLSREYGVQVTTVVKDFFLKDSAFELIQELNDQNLTIDVLVNNAGQGQYGEFIDTDIHRELDIIQLNINTVVILTKHYLQQMVSRGSGKILNLSSVASKVPGPWQAVYHGTKAFVQSFTEAIRSEVRDSGVTITALLPGATDTDFFNKAGMNDSKVVQGKLDDPAVVAKDGYEALMSGDDKVISGLKNKVQVATSNFTPDEEQVANMMYKQQEPVKNDQQ